MVQDETRNMYNDDQSGIGMFFVLVVVLMLMIGAFIWFVVRLDPLTTDFIGTDAPTVTATAEPEQN